MALVHSEADGLSVPACDDGKTEAKRPPVEQAAWDRACRAWALDTGSDPEKTGALGERLLYAATDLICAQDDIIDDLLAALRKAHSWMPVCLGVDDTLEADKALARAAIAKALGTEA